MKREPSERCAQSKGRVEEKRGESFRSLFEDRYLSDNLEAFAGFFLLLSLQTEDQG